ncbi:RHS repeat-associated core domain-containing protein [Chryseobacterium aureum]|uniref:RHS repeat-associated core domain-containing protein n=1 Tax=Chryseobacterium aureum TaxID=2497456 RepID=UPI000F88A364|nr:RHS repeat-associated core domain-containing protein [Chryseobacterium aureum]
MGGYYDFENLRYIYQYKDHLGNVRVSYVKNNEGFAEKKDTNEYYPFGMNNFSYFGSAYDAKGTPFNYKYNGKELQETGMYDYGARLYMADIGRWAVIDPLSEKYRRHSSYNYAVNNPIRFIDPDGRSIMPPENSGGFQAGHIWTDSDGSWVRVNDGWESQTEGQPNVIDAIQLLGKADGGYANMNLTYNNENTTGYKFLSTGYNKVGEYAGIESNISLMNTTYTNNTGTGALPLAVDIGGESSILSSSISGIIGTKDYNFSGNANGSMWSVNGNLSGGAFTGEGNKYGVLFDGNVGAQVLKGEVSGTATIFGISFKGTLGGTAAAAHIGATAGAFFDNANGTFNIQVQENVGLGLGEKGAIEIKIPIPFKSK